MFYSALLVIFLCIMVSLLYFLRSSHVCWKRQLAPYAFCLCLMVFAGCGNAQSPITSTHKAGASEVAMPTLVNQPTSASKATPTPTPQPTTTPTASQAQQGNATTGPTPTTTTSNDWTTYHRDNTRSGYVPGTPDPTQLTKAWAQNLDGSVYAEPLVVGGHVIVVTENDTFYALDPQAGNVLWHTNVGTPVPQSTLPCGDIDPLGITGTPVYDPATGLIFAVAEVTGPQHILVGVNASTGTVSVRRVVDPQGVNPLAYQQRAALVLSQNMVYVAYGGLDGDCGNYIGTVVASQTSGQGPLYQYQVPTPREGGIWDPSGPTVDANGNVYVSVGNGAETNGNWDNSDSVLRLSPTLQYEDGFAPSTWAQDNANDSDLGSTGPVILPNGLIFIVGKSSTGYVLRASALGGVGGQIGQANVCGSEGKGGAAYVGSQIFVPCTDGLHKVTIGDNGLITNNWSVGAGLSPVVGGNTVYSCNQNGTLYAFDINSGAQRASVSVGSLPHFVSPTIYNNQIFIGTDLGITAVTIS